MNVELHLTAIASFGRVTAMSRGTSIGFIFTGTTGRTKPEARCG